MSGFTVKIPDSLNSSTICLTGYTGYIGSHLLRSLIAMGIRPFLIPRAGAEAIPVKGALCAARWVNADELAEQLNELDNPAVINLAGHFVGQHMPQHLEPLIDGNVSFPLTIFEAMQLAGARRIVNIGSTWEFGGNGETQPRNLYGQLKRANADALAWFAACYDFQAVNLKLNDTFGGDDPRPKLLPLLKQNWLKGEVAQMRYWAQKLNLLHIVDVQEGLLAAAARTSELSPATVESALLLGRETVRAGELADLLSRQVAKGLRIEFADLSTENDSLFDVWDDGPKLANWEPRLGLQQGLTDYFGAKP